MLHQNVTRFFFETLSYIFFSVIVFLVCLSSEYNLVLLKFCQLPNPKDTREAQNCSFVVKLGIYNGAFLYSVNLF